MRHLVTKLLGSMCTGLLATSLALGAETLDDYDSALAEANVLFEKGKLAEALAAAQAAGKLAPNRFEAPAIAALILHAAGKTNQARQTLAEALRLAPADKKATLEELGTKLAGQANPTKSDAATSIPPPPTGAARRQFDTLVLIIEEADKATLADERKKLLEEFLEKSEPFLKANQDQLPIWTLRAIAALELHQAKAGWAAGNELKRLGAENSDDPKMRKVMASLDRKGWLGEAPPKVAASAAKSPVAEAPTARPPAEPQPKVRAFSEPAKQVALESICGTWEWSDLFSKGTIVIKPDGACTVDWNVMGHYHYEGRITDCDSGGTTFTTSLTEAGSHKTISIPVRRVSADRIKWNGSRFKKK